MSSVSSTSSMDSAWLALIDTTIETEKQQRLNKLTTQSDNLDVRKSIYTDLNTQLLGLKNSLTSLISTKGSYSLNSARSTSVSNPSETGASVISATANSGAAITNYKIEVTTLAQKARVSSVEQASSSSALGISGPMSITVGGKTTNFTVAGTDTLLSIVSKINSATYETGKGVSASIVANRLVLESASSGEDYAMSFSGDALVSLGVINSSNEIQNTLSTAKNAVFKVNGMSVTRSSNTGLTDVIPEVSLNLSADAEGKSATLNILSDTSTMKNSLKTFIDQYNALSKYLTQKTGSTKVDDTHYERGSLASDYSIRGLRAELADQVNFSSGTSNTIKYLSDLGITLDDSLNLTISDSDKLDKALNDNLNDVKNFLDAKMTSMDTLLSSYVGSDNSLVTYSLKSMDDQKKDLETDIQTENTRLDARRQALLTYYESLDDQMNVLLNTQKTLKSIYSIGYGNTNYSA